MNQNHFQTPATCFWEIEVSARRVPNSQIRALVPTVWHTSCGNLNFSRTVAGIWKWFWVTIKGYLSYLLPKFEDLVPTSLGSEAFWSNFGYMVISDIWSILAGSDVDHIPGTHCILNQTWFQKKHAPCTFKRCPRIDISHKKGNFLPGLTKKGRPDVGLMLQEQISLWCTAR